MGHYASEMDPSWGRETARERVLREMREDGFSAAEIRLADALESLATYPSTRNARTVVELLREVQAQ